MKKVLLTALFVVTGWFMTISFANSLNESAQNVTIKEPEIHIVAVNNQLAIAAMTLDNKSSHIVTLIAANTPAASETQLHQIIDRKMVQVKSIQIKPHGEDTLQANGFHIMLMGINPPLKTGDVVPLTLIFSDGSSLNVKAKVDKV
jgi:copper(I)-binding protein